jgi:hypothetical protein
MPVTLLWEARAGGSGSLIVSVARFIQKPAARHTRRTPYFWLRWNYLQT